MHQLQNRASELDQLLAWLMLLNSQDEDIYVSSNAATSWHIPQQQTTTKSQTHKTQVSNVTQGHYENCCSSDEYTNT